MALYVDIDQINDNNKKLKNKVDTFNNEVNKFNGCEISINNSEVKSEISNFVESIKNDLKAINTSCSNLTTVVTECSTAYKENDEETINIDIKKFQDIIDNNKDVTSEYKGSTAKKLSSFKSVELTSTPETAAIIAKYSGKSIKSLSNKEFLEYVAAMAQENYKKSGVLPSVTIAQAIHETGWGNYCPPNALFGIKGGNNSYKTFEYVNGQKVYTNASFRTYDSVQASVDDHANLLTNSSRYSKVMQACHNNDANQACVELQRAGYATDPNYAKYLQSYISKYNLTQYDK